MLTFFFNENGYDILIELKEIRVGLCRGSPAYILLTHFEQRLILYLRRQFYGFDLINV